VEPVDADPPGNPSPADPQVILEDLDRLESKRRGTKSSKLPPELRGTIRDPKVTRKLVAYATPHLPVMGLALLMSLFSAASKVAFLYVMMGILKPMFDGEGAATSDALGEVVLDLLPAVRPEASLLRMLSAVGAMLGGLFSLGWNTLEPLSQLKTAATLVVVLVTLEQLNKYGQKLLMRAVALNVVRDMRIDLFGKIMSLSMRFFHANNSGKLLSRITNDLNKLGNLLVDIMVHWFTDLFTVFASMLFIWIEGGPAVILALVLATVSFAPVQQLGRRIRNKEQKNQRMMAELFSSVAESFGAQKIVKAFGAKQHEEDRFADVNRQYTAGRMKSAELSARTEPMVEILGAIGIALFLFLGGRSVLDGNWSGPAFFAVVLALSQCIGSLRRLGDTSTKFQGGMSSADRVATLLYSDSEIVDAPDAQQLKSFETSIDFENVTYSHEVGRPVLRDIDIHLEKGQTLALVGHTGSGKSTIGDLVMRFYDVEIGAVRIDGVDVRKLGLDSMRNQMAMVTQETVLFEGTIASNIAYAMPDATPEDIERVARAAHAHEFILDQLDGYDTRVGERGATLSGGERQRIAIARALLRDKPILILDEATSALDTKSEQIVQEAIELLKKGRTTLIIAHRLSTIREADQILVLDQGRIVERGTHDELMAMDSVYTGMVRIQSAQR
jgi:subfamily B ATP-binding cassette protein MsbA